MPEYYMSNYGSAPIAISPKGFGSIEALEDAFFEAWKARRHFTRVRVTQEVYDAMSAPNEQPTAIERALAWLRGRFNRQSVSGC